MNSRASYSRHVKHCGKKTEPVPCPHCDSTFTRKSDMVRHVKRYHSEAVKRKADESSELDRLEILHSKKVPRLVVDEDQTGGAVSTRGTKRRMNEENDLPSEKVSRSLVDYSDTSDEDEIEEERDVPLFKATIAKMGPPKKWKRDKVIDQKLTFTLDQLREPESEEDLGVAAVQAITEGIDSVIEDMKIDPNKYDLALQIGSKEHRKESGTTGETWRVPADNYYRRLTMTQVLLRHMASVLNSGEFISSDRGFSASMTLIRREVKGGKRKGYKPGTRIWSEVCKELKCVHVIDNNDELCCARALVVMREHAKKQAGEENTFETIRRHRYKNDQQLKEAKLLHQEAGVPEGLCGIEEIETFQKFLGPQGYQLIVVDPARGGVIFTGEEFKTAPKVIQLAKTYDESADGETNAHYDGVFSIAPLFNRCKFCRYCCKGYNTEDSKHHNCLRANCPSCLRSRSLKNPATGCSDYTGWSKPTITCRECCRSFYGEECYQDHLTPKPQRETKLEEDARLAVANMKGVHIPAPEVYKSVCEMYQHCHTCGVSYKSKPGSRHRCGHGQCHNCLNYVDLYAHRCHIISDIYKANRRRINKLEAHDRLMKRVLDMTTEDGQLVKEVKDLKDVFEERQAHEGCKEGDEECEADCRGCEEDEGECEKDCEDCSDCEDCEECNEFEGSQTFSQENEWTESEVERLEGVKSHLQALGVDVTQISENKLEELYLEHFMLAEGGNEKHKELVFADIECSIDDNRQFTPNLICYETESSDKPYGCEGRDCLKQFYSDLINLIKDLAEQNCLKPIQVEIQVYFHNFRGFDGLFIIKQLLDMNLKVSKVLMTGQKILYFECGQLKFKDSLSFLNMPLEAFTKTFGLTEVKKGYFPHAFNRVENQDYEGPIPDLKYYETHCMSSKKKEAVEKWHEEQVAEGKTWNFRQELLEY